MTTSIEYEEKAQYQIDHIDEIGMKAIEVARLYTQLAIAAAIREQNNPIHRSWPVSGTTGGELWQ